MSKFNISIVEDDKLYASIISYKLAQNDEYNVSTCHSAEEFIEQQKESKSDIIILDYNLSSDNSYGVNGLELAEMYDNTPKIFISGQNDISLAVEMIKKGGGVNYLEKEKDVFDKIEESVKEITEHLTVKRNIDLAQRANKKRLTRIAAVAAVSIISVIVSYYW